MSSTSSQRLEPFNGLVLLPSGTRLETTILLPNTFAGTEDNDPGNRLALLLHPWSWLGGKMDDPILYMLMGPLQERGYHVLRYNSRGVGKSSGWPSLTGMREVQDLKELIQWALAYISSVVSVVVIGYSYGALIASLLPALPGLRISHVLLSYPLGPRHWLTAFHGKAYTKALITLINNNRSNVLLLYGDCDEFTPAESYDAWAHKLVQETEGGQQGRLKIVKIDSGTHFWRESDCARRLIETIEQWLP